MAEKKRRILERITHPALLLPLVFAVVIALALVWYPALFQPGYAPADPAPFFAEASALVDINSASLAELTALPGIGEGRAAAIIEYREAHGPFAASEDVMEVKGIGPGIYEDIRDLITAGKPDSRQAEAV